MQYNGKDVNSCLDFDARIQVDDENAFRSNRELLLDHSTYMKMKDDASKGREFNDIIIEYNISYNPIKPLKIWGGQHRSKSYNRSNYCTGSLSWF